MMEHYYSKQPQTESNRQQFETKIRNMPITFITDRGVFSKGDIDFGSRSLIESFILPEVPGDLLDMGCGYGPIGITLAKCFSDRHVTMVDVNERAVQLAKENAQKNGVQATVFQSDRFEKVEGTFAAILTNPPIRAGKQVVHSIFREAHGHLVKGGDLWVVIQKKQGAPSALKYLEELYDDVTTVKRNKGYYIFQAKKL
ncbi:methyltransferase [Terrilactibacillus sp. BCM23-1]|uniref:Methyltransferase n=1 Tax=Terrilactibacillus tamarindi TaxID=2599694 RepID=A0A6N8CU31_9BACI|nr:class I SAM-dependent methyltransferase [Terrilactibacillus tamarindi]MTT32777.1 methyltransferase [Terrilactibacillus tamarindi]